MKTEETKSFEERLVIVKCEIADEITSKSGVNDFKGFSYLELTDFQKPLLKKLRDHGLTSYFSYENQIDPETGVMNVETLSLTIKDFLGEKHEGRTWKLPLKQAVIQGATEIQNFGGALTYTRRYLWMLALELAVPDLVDKTSGNPNAPKAPAKARKSASEKQKEWIRRSDPELVNRCLTKLNVASIDDLDISQASQIIEALKKYKAGNNAAG